jgi:hypothetical protein
VSLRLTKAAGAEKLDLQEKRQKKYADVQLANLDRTLDNLQNLAALSTNPEQIGGYIGMGTGMIEAFAQGGTVRGPGGEEITLPGGLLTRVDAVKRKDKFLENLSLLKARQELQADPKGFITRVDQYTSIDPLKRQSLVEHAGKLQEQRENAAEREARQKEADERRRLKAWQSANSQELMLAIRQGKANLNTVMEWAGSGRLDEADTRFYLNYFDIQGRRASEAADRAERRAEREQDRGERNTFGELKTQLRNDEITPEQVLQVAKSKKYSGRLSGELADLAIETKQSGQQALSAETRELRTQFNRMEEEVKSEFLGVASGLNTRITEQSEQIWARFQEHARALSKAWSPSPDAVADPWAVKEQIIDEYRDQLRGVVKTGTKTTLSLIPPRYRPVEDANGDPDFTSIQEKLGELRRDYESKRLKGGEAEYRLQADRLRQLSRGRAATDALPPLSKGPTKATKP